MVISFLLSETERIRFSSRKAFKPAWKALPPTNSGKSPFQFDPDKLNSPEFLEIELNDQFCGWAVMASGKQKGRFEVYWFLTETVRGQNLEGRILSTFRDLAMTIEWAGEIVFWSEQDFTELLPDLSGLVTSAPSNGVHQYLIPLDKKKSARNW